MKINFFTPPRGYEVVAVGSVGNNVIGVSGLYDIDWHTLEAEVRTIIKEEYRNLHYGSSLFKEVVKYGFETLKLNSMYVNVDNDNKPSLAVCRNAGFVEKGLTLEITRPLVGK